MLSKIRCSLHLIVQCINGFFPDFKTRFNCRFYLQRFSDIIRENKMTVARDEMDFDHLILPGMTKKDFKIFLLFKILDEKA
jgi:hypothetical protein